MLKLVVISFFAVHFSVFGSETKAESFVERVNAVINAKNYEQYKSLISNSCLVDFNDSELLERLIQMELKYSVAKDSVITIEEVGDVEELPLRSRFDYAPPPSHRVVIKSEGRTRSYFLINEGDQWGIYMPTPKKKH
ncbi:hypothetical protein [Sulfuriroseicoccus oceanibius]|uniref:Uncharacterized protein n=1 Tax=Sulfuriroseicoccus oceanibius TaxID=2707525 RepID=A0A6B3L8U2_9BACT|nr:hypothetical protein [Sulfuriroseicoccus oceanibius]QQL46300.1 hypothetical protein G3M56_006930 [Sulfuriroseicoccus oceanibius]